MERAVQPTHHAIVVDTITFFPKPKALNPKLLRAFYIEKGLSAAQIAQHLGVSKGAILNQLKKNSISAQRGRENNPNNFRKNNPPYGYRVLDGKLASNSRELRICRLIVELVGRRGMTLHGAADELERLRIKKRNGSKQWHHSTVGIIFKRWKDKI